MRFRFHTIVVCVLFLISPSRSKAQHMNAPDAPCQHEGSNAEETACFIRMSKAADLELNRVYGTVLKTVDGDDTVRLKTAQRLWVQFRDANCAAETGLYQGGSAAPTVFYACLEAVTRSRTKELKMMYDWIGEK